MKLTSGKLYRLIGGEDVFFDSKTSSEFEWFPKGSILLFLEEDIHDDMVFWFLMPDGKRLLGYAKKKELDFWIEEIIT